METERITVDPSRLCRACGAERLQMFPLSARDPDAGLRLDNMLMECTDLKVYVCDGLPSSICYSCADELKTSYRFKQQCETTDRYFNELGLKSNEIKQEQETIIFKEDENEDLLELKEEKDANDDSSSLFFIEVPEGNSEAVVISRETTEDHGDPLTITETIVYKQEENFSEVTEDEAIRVGNLEDSPPNEDLRFVHFPYKNENRNIISKESENEFPSGSKERKEEEIIHDSSSEASASSKDDDSDYFPKEERRKYSSSSNLRMHTQTHENGGRKRFKCEACGKSFSTSRYLREHRQIHENGERKHHRCDVCAKSFSASWNLRVHARTHEDGAKARFECDVCDKSFSTSRYLRVHKRMHENGERKYYECEVCARSYSTSWNLRQHARTHENGAKVRFKCDVCAKTFSANWYLREHELMHANGERKYYRCDVCDKSYSTSRYLREHKKTHENNIVYERK